MFIYFHILSYFSYIIIYYHILSITYYHILSYIIIYYHLLSFIIIYYHLLSYIIIYYQQMSCIIIYYHILSYIIIYYYHLLSYIIIGFHIFSYIIIYYHIIVYIESTILPKLSMWFGLTSVLFAPHGTCTEALCGPRQLQLRRGWPSPAFFNQLEDNHFWIIKQIDKNMKPIETIRVF